MRSALIPGLLAASVAVSAPAAFAQRAPDRSPVSPRLLRGITPAQLLRGLVEVDFEIARANLNRYRTVQVEQALSRDDVASLTRLVEGDSLARRNRDLLTGVLRNAEAIGDAERVVGLAATQRLIFVMNTAPPAPAAVGRTGVTAERVEEADATVLVRDLTELDFEAVRGDLNRYRIVQAEDVLSPGKRRLLSDAIERDSLARRNRDLLTAALRGSGSMTSSQRVIGVSTKRRIVYVTASRLR
ncbi:MAG: hypothetical protein ACO1SX_02395 [Actinomycetota bacterium]